MAYAYYAEINIFLNDLLKNTRMTRSVAKLPFGKDFHKPLLDNSHFLILSHFLCNR